MGTMSLVSDSERERAASSLRRQYVQGRLSLEQLAERMELVFAARRRSDFGPAFAELPPLWRDPDELRRIARRTKRAVVRSVVAAAWIFVTLVLLVALAVDAIAHGFTVRRTIAFAVAWLVVTALCRHVRRRAL
jgi:Domain of unknown function (DUF1707)